MSLSALKEEAVRSDPRLVSSAGVTGGLATDEPLRTIEPHGSFRYGYSRGEEIPG